MTYSYSAPESNAYRSIEIRIDAHQWEWRDRSRIGVPYDRVEVRFRRLRGPETVYRISRPAFTPEERRAFYDRESQMKDLADLPSAFDHDGLFRWMRAQGLDTNNPQVRDEMQTIADAVDRMLMGRMAYSTAPGFASTFRPTYSGYYFGRPRWMIGIFYALFVLVWLPGLRYFGKRRTLAYERSVPPIPV